MVPKIFKGKKRCPNFAALVVCLIFTCGTARADVDIYFYNNGNDFVIDWYGSLDVTGVPTNGPATTDQQFMRIDRRSSTTSVDRFEMQINPGGAPAAHYFFTSDQEFDEPGSLTIPNIGMNWTGIDVQGSGFVGFYLNGTRDDLPFGHTIYLPTAYAGETLRVQGRLLNRPQFFSGTGSETIQIGTQALRIYSGVVPVGLPSPADFANNSSSAVPEISSNGAAASLAAILSLMLLLREALLRSNPLIRIHKPQTV